MRLPGDDAERSSGLPPVYMIVGVFLVAAVIFAVVAAVNKKDTGAADRNAAAAAETAAQQTAVEEEVSGMGQDGGALGIDGLPVDDQARVEQLYKEGRLRPEDLDFWDMYREEEQTASEQQRKEEERKKEEEDKKKEEEEADPATDGRHTKVINRDGTEEWLVINPFLGANNYDNTKLIQKGGRMGYYQEEKETSFVGADVSKYNGKVNFTRLKQAGIDYVMLRVGARGYGSGQIILDENYEENIRKATEAGLDVGLYFFSQAVSEQEAIEEADFVLQNIGEYKITYPIAFDMEFIENDTARIETLSQADKTAVAQAFINTVKTAGYQPMLYGDKEWLLKEIELPRLTGAGIWLSQPGDIPDYPYQFQMWQYSVSGQIDGIEGNANLNISFIDYAER